MKHISSDKIFGVVNGFILIILGLICMFPFINIAAVSLSSNDAIITRKVTFFPVGMHWRYYTKVLSDISMLNSMKFTVLLTVAYVILALIFTVMLAYPLSRKRLKGRKVIIFLVTFTMYFNGGIIPTYMVVQKLGLLNSTLSLILPVMINTYYMIIMKSFFSSVPESLIESAIIDGCNEIRILIKIILPLSLPVIATMSLFYAVFRWNSFQDAVFYMSDPKKFPLQLKLRQLISANQINMDIQTDADTFATEGIKAASLMFATIPILLVYPWLQKYFVKGMTIGAVKG